MNLCLSMWDGRVFFISCFKHFAVWIVDPPHWESPMELDLCQNQQQNFWNGQQNFHNHRQKWTEITNKNRDLRTHKIDLKNKTVFDSSLCFFLSAHSQLCGLATALSCLYSILHCLIRFVFEISFIIIIFKNIRRTVCFLNEETDLDNLPLYNDESPVPSSHHLYGWC